MNKCEICKKDCNILTGVNYRNHSELFNLMGIECPVDYFVQSCPLCLKELLN